MPKRPGNQHSNEGHNIQGKSRQKGDFLIGSAKAANDHKFRGEGLTGTDADYRTIKVQILVPND